LGGPLLQPLEVGNAGLAQELRLAHQNAPTLHAPAHATPGGGLKIGYLTERQLACFGAVNERGGKRMFALTFHGRRE
jgi:hypothetical protein